VDLQTIAILKEMDPTMGTTRGDTRGFKDLIGNKHARYLHFPLWLIGLKAFNKDSI